MNRSISLLLGVAILGPALFGTDRVQADNRPNVLWITCEDMSPNLGCYGDAYATTPHIDRLAARGIRYTSAFATAPVCSPARSCLITGVYATTLGTQNLRSSYPIPDAVTGFPALLRQAGYFCTNRVKTDYNTSDEPRIIAASWDECSVTAHWKHRRPGQPFFAVFNQMVTHQGPTSVLSYERFQSEIQSQLAPELRHDPARAPVPPYWPDTPITRRTIARYYDCITLMDQEVGRLLAEIGEAGLADDTIVFFYSDHGAGLPRHKRLVLDSGLHVPLLVYFPPKYAHLAPAGAGATTDRLVSFVDFAPSLLSLLGLPIPPYMQGEPFLGKAAKPPRQYVYGARDRVDEAYDLARSVRDGRYLYVRNYMPHLSYNQPEGFSDQAEVRREITRLAAEGKLDASQMAYAGPTRPREALYDVEADPMQLANLAGDPRHEPALGRMRAAHRAWVLATRDLGFLPEEALARVAAEGPAMTWAKDESNYPLARILDAAELVGAEVGADRLARLLGDPLPAVRYWAAVALRAMGTGAAEARPALAEALDDTCAAVRIEAAGVLASLEGDPAAWRVLSEELAGDNPQAALHAARTIQLLGTLPAEVAPSVSGALARADRFGDKNVAMFLHFALDPVVGKAESGKPKAE